MAADASLPVERISGAMHAMFNMLSKPDTLPELSALQVVVLVKILNAFQSWRCSGHLPYKTLPSVGP